MNQDSPWFHWFWTLFMNPEFKVALKKCFKAVSSYAMPLHSKTKNEGLWDIQTPSCCSSPAVACRCASIPGTGGRAGKYISWCWEAKALAELTGGPGPTPADDQRFLCLVWMLIFRVGHGIRSQFIRQAWLKPYISLVPLNNQVQHFGSSDKEKFALFSPHSSFISRL